MELHRLAIAVVALLLAATMVIAAGRIASGEEGSSNLVTPASRSDDAPVVRLGSGRESSATPPRLLSQPTPPATVTPPARQDRSNQESNAPDSVSGGAG